MRFVPYRSECHALPASQAVEGFVASDTITSVPEPPGLGMESYRIASLASPKNEALMALQEPLSRVLASETGE